jgi:hypothetical protein
MKMLKVLLKNGCPFFLFLVLLLADHSVQAQSCPATTTTTLNGSSYFNTYYRASQTTVAAGSNSIVLGSAVYGSTPISSGDIVLVIQMQGSQITSTNNYTYGDGTGVGGGYLANSSMYAGAMEYAVATSNVPVAGGTLTLSAGLINNYSNNTVGTEGQRYSYQVIRVPIYYDVKVTANLSPPSWDGLEGGVLVLCATDNINLNGHTIDVSARGFRGGGGRKLRGSSGGANTDYAMFSSNSFHGSKGEGLAGTPKYTNQNDVSLVTGANEGYTNGSYGQGAPGNAGGGGTDGDPIANDQNTGGGGGGNGGTGGQGGYAWSSADNTGGRGGAIFMQASASRLVMGGGGGAGTNNDGTGTPANGFASSGAAGGGILILRAGNAITGTGTLLANGDNGNTTVLNDGAGGGGAGGSILIYSNNGVTSNITAQANGGNGGSNEVSGGPSHGPGGGGGCGIIMSNGTLNAASSITGGTAGTTAGQTTNYGATNGLNGVKYTNVSPLNFSNYPLICQVLGVSFIDVTALADKGNINLQWEVAREINTSGYVVERSTDGSHYTDIATVPYKAAQGADNQYQYVDVNGSGLQGTVFYRIREVDADGNFMYSKTITIQTETLAGKVSVYPNPTSSVATVSFTLAADANISLRLFDLSGRELWARQYSASAGSNSVSIDCIRSLPEGVYILQWFNQLQAQQAKILVRH